MLQGRLDQFLQEHREIVCVDSFYTRAKSPYLVRLPDQESVALYRFLGWVHGDGNMSGRRILITDECLQHHETEIRDAFSTLFNLRPNIYEDRQRHSYYSHIKCGVLYDYLVEVMEMPNGSVRRDLDVSRCMEESSVRLRASYVGGLYDAEGHVKKRQLEIDFLITSESIQRVISKTLSELGIDHSLHERKRSSVEYEVYIYGRDDVAKFRKHVTFAHPVKKVELEMSLTSALNTRVVPAVNDAS
jgi:intein/homing endonuclease